MVVGNDVSAHPRWLLAIRIVQIVLAVVILGLTAYSASIITNAQGLDAGYGLSLFSAVATMIINIWLIVSVLALPVAYNFWANLATDIFLTVFWLISFAVLAAYTDQAGKFDIDVGFFTFVSVKSYTPWQTGAAAAGLGGLEFLLFVVTLVLFGLNLHKTRVGGVGTVAGGAPVTQEAKYQAGQPVPAGVQPTVTQVPQASTGPAVSTPATQSTQPYPSPAAQQAYPAAAPAPSHTPAPTSQTYSSDPEAVPQTGAPGHFTNQPVGTQNPY